MNMKMPDFNVKKLVKEAGSTLQRAIQVKTYFSCITHLSAYITFVE